MNSNDLIRQGIAMLWLLQHGRGRVLRRSHQWRLCARISAPPFIGITDRAAFEQELRRKVGELFRSRWTLRRA